MGGRQILTSHSLCSHIPPCITTAYFLQVQAERDEHDAQDEAPLLAFPPLPEHGTPPSIKVNLSLPDPEDDEMIGEDEMFDMAISSELVEVCCAPPLSSCYIKKCSFMSRHLRNLKMQSPRSWVNSTHSLRMQL